MHVRLLAIALIIAVAIYPPPAALGRYGPAPQPVTIGPHITPAFNWTDYFVRNLAWTLEWFNTTSGSFQPTSDLTIGTTTTLLNRTKYTLNFTASNAGTYRLNVSIAGVKTFQAGTEHYNLTVLRDDQIARFSYDWSDTRLLPFAKSAIIRGDVFTWSMVIPNVPLGLKITVDPVTIGTSTSAQATSHGYQRKICYQQAIWWVFYSDGSNFVFRTSTDGTTWSAATSFQTAALSAGSWFSVNCDGTRVRYAYAIQTALQYRSGVTNADETITWDAALQQVAPSIKSAPDITVDTDGFPVISYETDSLGTPDATITKSSVKTGTWTNATGFPFALASDGAGIATVRTVPLSGGRLYAVYHFASETLKGRLYDGTTWSAEETATTSTLAASYSFSVAAYQDSVHVIFFTGGFANLIHVVRSTGGTWSAQTTVQAATTDASAQCLAVDTLSNNAGELYAFWDGDPTLTSIFYKRRSTSGSWDSTPTEWITGETLSLFNGVCSYDTLPVGGAEVYIGYAYVTGAASPFNVRFNYIALPVQGTPPGEEPSQGPGAGGIATPALSVINDTVTQIIQAVSGVLIAPGAGYVYAGVAVASISLVAISSYRGRKKSVPQINLRRSGIKPVKLKVKQR